MALPKAEAASLAEKARASRREVESLVGSIKFVSHSYREAKWRKHLFQPLVGHFPIRDRGEAKVLPEEFPKGHEVVDKHGSHRKMVASPPPNRVGSSLDRRVRLRMGSPFGVRGLGERALDPAGTELSYQYEGIDRSLEGF